MCDDVSKVSRGAPRINIKDLEETDDLRSLVNQTERVVPIARTILRRPLYAESTLEEWQIQEGGIKSDKKMMRQAHKIFGE